MRRATGPKISNIRQVIASVDWLLASTIAIVVIVVFVFFIQFTTPITDGDPWWQMAYARYFLEHNTLISDHSVFTWSDVDTRPIYCAWVSQLLLYCVYKVAGLPGFFALRYMMMATFLLLFWQYARKVGLHRNPLTWLICLLGVLMSVNAGLVKPELFSYFLICLTVYLWFFIKTVGEDAYRHCYFFPLIILFWANSHGGFVFGCLFLLLIGVGESINSVYSPSAALPPRLRRHLLVSLLLSCLAIFLTPYGYHYPYALVQGAGDFDRNQYAVVHAWKPIFAAGFRHFHYVDFLLVGGILIVAFLVARIRQKRFDWAILLINVLMVYFYVSHARATYVWAPVFCFSAVYFLRDHRSVSQPATRKIKVALTTLPWLTAAFLGGRSYDDRFNVDYQSTYPGLGLSDCHPVEEAEFIAEHLSEYRVGNDYNIGGYLIWRLGPERKILIDSRYFPFREWFDEYVRFGRGTGVREFLEKYRADVWVLWHQKMPLIQWFLESPDWLPVYYGDSAMVFVSSEVEFGPELAGSGSGIFKIRNFAQALTVLHHAASLGHWRNVDLILASMKKRFPRNSQQDTIQALESLVWGHKAYSEGEFQQAVVYLEKAQGAIQIRNSRLLAAAYMQLAGQRWAENDLIAAKSIVDRAVALFPQDPSILYNAGVVNWYVAKSGAMKIRSETIGRYLNGFIRSSINSGLSFQAARNTAATIMSGQFREKPRLLLPTGFPLSAACDQLELGRVGNDVD